MPLTLIACECGRADCAEVIGVDGDEWGRLHADGSRAIAPGHISGAVDEVVVSRAQWLPGSSAEPTPSTRRRGGKSSPASDPPPGPI